jgi:prolipoprotein diacylglyceryltransferase
MYATLSDILKDLFGINIPLPIQTFGLMMAVSFLIASYTLVLEIKRRENNGLLKPVLVSITKGLPATTLELITAALIGFLIGFKIVEAIFNYGDLVANPQEFILSKRGNLLGGILVAVYSAWSRYREKEKEKLAEPILTTQQVWPHSLVLNITMYAAIFGLLGAKIFHNLENLEDFGKDPIDALISFSGLTYYGGLICAAIAVMWYAKSKLKIPPLMMCDIAAPGLMLSYGTGRIGCHLSGDGDWGIANTLTKPNWFIFPDWMWAYNYPHNVIGEGVHINNCMGKHCTELIPPVFPTPLYEAIACIALFFVLWGIRKNITISGILFCVYLILNGTERLLIEQIRVNTKYHFWGYSITQAELISVALIFTGITGVLFLKRKRRHN